MPSLMNRLIGAFSTDLAIDLGTANTLVHARGRGIIANEPSVVAVDARTNRVRAIGAEAKSMIGRTPGFIRAVRPLRKGGIADFATAEAMLRYFIRSAHTRTVLIRPRVVIAVSSGITEVERRAVREAAFTAGVREIHLIEEPMAAAIGAGLPVSEPSGSMVVDIGGGTTEVAVISLGGIVHSRSLRVGGDRFDEAILSYLRRKENLLVGEQTAERIKLEIGSVWPSDDDSTVQVKGRDLLGGVPKTIEIRGSEVREALADSVEEIIEAVRAALERTPPELAADISGSGIVLTGGGSLLPGLDRVLGQATGLTVMLADEPMLAVVNGCGACLEERGLLDTVTKRA